MSETEQKRFVAGTPPWLLIFLMLLVWQLPSSYKMLLDDINDAEMLNEQNLIDITVAQVEDVNSLFPPDMSDLLSLGEMSTEQLDAFLIKEKQKAERQLEWLKDGACTRFRDMANQALIGIAQAKHMSDEMKELSRQIVQGKKEAMALTLEALSDNDLLDLVRQEGREPPSTMGKDEMVAYLLEINEEQREKFSSDWRRLDHQVRPTMQGSSSIEVWRLQIEQALFWISNLIDFGILPIPILGLLFVVFPHLLRWWIERSKGLRERTGEFPELDELQTFVSKSVPRIELRENLLIPDYAFVYPAGYRRPRIAVLSKMYSLWRKYPEKAKGMLLHEIEHVRQGDYLIVGYGRFFERYLKWLFISFVMLVAAQFTVNAVFSMASLGIDLRHLTKTLGIYAGGGASSSLDIFFQTMNKIIIPLFGIWALELNADYGASREWILPLELGAGAPRPVGIIRSFWGILTHPPLWLRMWLIKKDDLLRNSIRHLVFPFSFFIKIIFLFFMGFFLKLSGDKSLADTIAWLLDLSIGAFADMYWLFGGMAALIMFWPYLGTYWERFFAGEGRLYHKWDSGRCIAALSLGALAVLAWWLRHPA